MNKVKDGKRYVASRFNVKAGSGDDLVLYNSLTGAMGKVLPENRGLVENALSNGIEGELNGVLKELCARGFFIPAGADELQKARELYMVDRYRNDTLHLIVLPTEGCFGLGALLCQPLLHSTATSEDARAQNHAVPKLKDKYVHGSTLTRMMSRESIFMLQKRGVLFIAAPMEGARSYPAARVFPKTARPIASASIPISRRYSSTGEKSRSAAGSSS